jgi:hypothetical protein
VRGDQPRLLSKVGIAHQSREKRGRPCRGPCPRRAGGETLLCLGNRFPGLFHAGGFRGSWRWDQATHATGDQGWGRPRGQPRQNSKQRPSTPLSLAPAGVLGMRRP